MLKTSFPFILACLFSLQVRAFAEAPLQNELEDANEVENAVPDESHVNPKQETLPDIPATPPPSEPAPSQRRANENAGEYEKKQSSSSGEMIFDWSKHQGETSVKHPFAEKGLIRITKDKTYIYKVKENVATGAMSFQAGVLDPKNLKNPDAKEGEANSTFKDNYGNTASPTILLTREYDGWVGALGKINYRIGSGVFVAQGHGHFVHDTLKQPLENFSFLALPNSAGLVYRMQFSDRPLFVPYVEGGVTGWLMVEIRDDKKGPKFGVSPSGYGAAGLAINMTYFDYLTRIHINHEYGITGIYFTVEYRRMQAIVSRYDFSGDYINGGFLMRY